MPHLSSIAGAIQKRQFGFVTKPSCQLWYSAGAPLAATLAFCLLTLLHVVANIRAMQALHLQSINPHRLQMLLRTFLAEVKPHSVFLCEHRHAIIQKCSTYYPAWPLIGRYRSFPAQICRRA